jgi:O-antigen/teichoic acid export membrane protein
MAALNLNMPRYFIHARLGERQLGIYSALAYTTVAMILVSDSLGHCAIPRLSRLYSAGLLTEYRSLLLRLLAAGGMVGLAGLTVAQFLGVPMLTLLYGKEYAAHSGVFRMLILATAIYCVACMFTSAVTAARSFRIQVPVYTMVVGANALACAHWVPIAGLAGGAAGMLVAATVHLVLGAAIVGRLLWAARLTSLPESPRCVDDWEASI